MPTFEDMLLGFGVLTRWEEARTVVHGAVALATLGVLATAVGMGLFAWSFLGLPPMVAFLLGGIVASTDAAAVFALFAGRGVRLKGRLRPLLGFSLRHAGVWVTHRIRLDVERLYPVLTLALAVAAYGLTKEAGGVLEVGDRLLVLADDDALDALATRLHAGPPPAAVDIVPLPPAAPDAASR